MWKKFKLSSHDRKVGVLSLLFLLVALPVSLLALAVPTGFFNRAAGGSPTPTPITPPITPSPTSNPCGRVIAMTVDQPCSDQGFYHAVVTCPTGNPISMGSGGRCISVDEMYFHAKNQCLMLSGCSTPVPTPSIRPTPTPQPTITPVPTVRPTSTPKPRTPTPKPTGLFPGR